MNDPEAGTAEIDSSAAHRMEFPLFDYARLIAASSVLYSHAFLLANGKIDGEIVNRLLGGELHLGNFAVLVFLGISGFLVTQSALSSRDVADYATKRIARIYPGLIACLFLTSTLLGTAFSTIGGMAYLRSLEPIRYTLHVLWSFSGFSIRNVMFYADNPDYGSSMNGVLWTLLQEVRCYAILGILLVLRAVNMQTIGALFAATQVLALLALGSLYEVSKNFGDFFFVAPSFFAGALLWLAWCEKRALPSWPLLSCLVLFVLAIWQHKAIEMFPLYGIYPLLWLVTQGKFHPPSLRKIGDASYGIYIYGWPLAQMCRALLGPENATPTSVFLTSLAASVLVGFLSWHFIEKPGMKRIKSFWRSRRYETGRAHFRSQSDRAW